MASPEVSSDLLHGNAEPPLPVRAKGEELTTARAESEVRLCVEESSAMTPTDELHSTDSASFPSLSDDAITDDDITDDVTTNDITTTEDITTVGGTSPEPPSLKGEELLKTDFTGSAALPSSANTPPPSTSAAPASTVAPPTLPETPPTTSTTTPSSSLSPPPPSVSAVSSPSVSSTTPPAAVATPPAAVAAPPPAAEAGCQEFYLVKWITWKEKRTPIVTQSQNGPCPLLAIMNTLFLRWKAKLPAQTEVVTTEDLMTHLGECVLSASPREKSGGDGVELNFQQNMSDAMAVLPKLSTGLDVNVRFTGVTDFEYTPECIVFDLLDIPLYHGWLTDPQSPETVAAVGKLSYNQLVEKIIDCKHSADNNKVSEGLVAEQFLESTASQLSYHGLCELTTTAKEQEISVFFRNNHFSTMIKQQGHLYLLVTDQGFLSEERLVWESLHNVEGDGNFCDAHFRLLQKNPDYSQSTGAQSQIDQDYLVAVSLQQQQTGDPVSMSDAELARQLQEEEYQQQQQQQQQQSPAQSTTQPAARGSSSQTSSGRRRDKESDCVLL